MEHKEHTGCTYLAFRLNEWIWTCNKCGWLKMKKNDQGI